MAVDHNNPQSRDEEILIATIDGKEYNKNPQSRMEELLLELKETIEEGGGGGGTSDYENLSNQPQVNGETLIGDKSGADLGLVDAEEGKGLSTNDYDDTEKAAVAAATSAISAMKDGSEIDSFGDVEVALLDKQGTILHGAFDPSDGENGDLYIKTVSSSNMDVCGTPTANTGDGYEISTNVSIYSNYEAYKAFGDGDGFGKNGMGDATLVYHATSGKKFKPSRISLCNNFDVSGGFLTSKGYAYASTDGVNWDTLFSFFDLSTKNESISFDITTDKYYSYFEFSFGGSGGYPGIKNIVILGESDSEDDNRVENMFYKQDGKWLKDAFVKKSDLDDVPTANSNNPVKSGGVKSAIDSAVSRCYHHAGTKTVSQLTHDLLIAANEGNVYNMTDSGTTTADFIEGAGQPIKAGDNVGIAKISDGVYKFDLLSGFVDTTNFVQKSQTAGLLKNDGTVNTTIEGDVASLKSGLTDLDTEVNGDATTYPYADVITIEDAVPANLADCSVKIEPVQDLHGYDKPWVGGAGKNEIQMTLDNLKTWNTLGTWNDNVYSYNNVTVTVNTDDGGNVTEIIVNTPQASAQTTFKVGTVNNIGQYWLTGCPEGGSQDTYALFINNLWVFDYGPGANANISATGDNVSILVANGATVSNKTFNPMLCLSSNPEPKVFAPYTNICPISGHTEASVQRDGKNLFDISSAQQGYDIKNDGSIVSASDSHYVSDYIMVKAGATYHQSATGDWANIGNAFYDGSKNFIGFISGHDITENSNNFTIPNGALYCRITAFVGVQLEYGNTGSTFTPFAGGKTYTIALGSTIYGGTVDFDSGVMTVDRATATVATLVRNNDKSFYQSISPTPKANQMNISQIICDRATTGDRSNTDTVFINATNALRVNTSVACSTGAEAIEYYGGSLTVCYELATPFTVQLTPQQIQLLQGQNTLTASTGDISVTVNGVSGSIGQVQEQVNELSANVGGAKLKTLKYTGTGTTSYTLDFGDDTPATIMQIIPEPGETVITNNYEYLSGFAWGVPFTYCAWANKSNNLPSSHGGFNISQITYSDNTCTIIGPSASAAANYEGQKYAVYYLA